MIHVNEPHNRLLDPGTRPPDFGFGDAGAFYKLSQFRNERRVLLLFCPGDPNPACIDGMRMVKRDWRQFRDHELAVILVSSAPMERLAEIAAAEMPPVIQISDERGETAARYGVLEGSPVAYLIELNGSISAVWTHWPSSREVFKSIDWGTFRQTRAA